MSCGVKLLINVSNVSVNININNIPITIIIITICIIRIIIVIAIIDRHCLQLLLGPAKPRAYFICHAAEAIM